MTAAAKGFEIRRIRSTEGMQLRSVRLRALADAPMAFASTLGDEARFPDAIWHERAGAGAEGKDRVTFIAEENGRWIGLATGLWREPDRPGPTLVGMFTDPGERGRGVGTALVEAVAAWARERGAGHLYLWVTSTNRPAISLYRRCGFRQAGEVRARAHTPTVQERRMVRDLTEPSACGPEVPGGGVYA
jgi:GNAT superfamily N-acetyltransferase